jgi:hypothetical protein
LVFAHDALDLDVACDVVLLEDRLDLKIDIGGAPQPRPWPSEPLT